MNACADDHPSAANVTYQTGLLRDQLFGHKLYSSCDGTKSPQQLDVRAVKAYKHVQTSSTG